MELKVDPSIILRAFDPNGEEYRAFLYSILFGTDQSAASALRLCVDWDGYDVRNGALYQEYSQSLARLGRDQEKFTEWWNKLAARDAIFPRVARSNTELEASFPNWKRHEYVLINLARISHGKERSIVTEIFPEYGPTYYQQEILRRLTEDESLQIDILDLEAAFKLIQSGWTTGAEPRLPNDKGDSSGIKLAGGERVQLLRDIKAHFGFEDLVNELCFPLEIDCADVWAPTDGHMAAVRRLIEYCERRPPMIGTLVRQCASVRKNVPWPQLAN
jgi:hypothetical protein